MWKYKFTTSIINYWGLSSIVLIGVNQAHRCTYIYTRFNNITLKSLCLHANTSLNTSHYCRLSLIPTLKLPTPPVKLHTRRANNTQVLEATYPRLALHNTPPVKQHTRRAKNTQVLEATYSRFALHNTPSVKQHTRRANNT
jgi:hypothetical protein